MKYTKVWTSTDPTIVVTAATLSHSFITDRNFPDKTANLVNEAASRIRMKTESASRPVESGVSRCSGKSDSTLSINCGPVSGLKKA